LERRKDFLAQFLNIILIRDGMHFYILVSFILTSEDRCLFSFRKHEFLHKETYSVPMVQYIRTALFHAVEQFHSVSIHAVAVLNNEKRVNIAVNFRPFDVLPLFVLVHHFSKVLNKDVWGDDRLVDN
jgi:hypothetical protein